MACVVFPHIRWKTVSFRLVRGVSVRVERCFVRSEWNQQVSQASANQKKTYCWNTIPLIHLFCTGCSAPDVPLLFRPQAGKALNITSTGSETAPRATRNSGGVLKVSVRTIPEDSNAGETWIQHRSSNQNSEDNPHRFEMFLLGKFGEIAPSKPSVTAKSKSPRS